MTPAETIKQFKKTRWYLPTVRRYHQHLKMCKELGCETLIEPFLVFVNEVLNAPERVRDDLLAVTELEPYEPPRRYQAYIEPTKQEQRLDLYSAAMNRKLR
jgi:hypothetical protein